MNDNEKTNNTAGRVVEGLEFVAIVATTVAAVVTALIPVVRLLDIIGIRLD